MKKQVLLFLALLMTGRQVSIVGKWEIDTYLEKVTVSTGQVVTDSTESTHGDNLVFLANGTVYSYVWYDLTVNYSTENKHVSLGAMTDARNYSSDTAAYRVSGSQLILTKGGQSATVQIKWLNDHQVVLYTSVEDTLAPNVYDKQESWRVLFKAIE